MIKSVVLALFVSLTLQGQNFLAPYSFSAVTGASGITDPTPCPLLSGMTFGPFRAIGASLNPNASGRFSFTGWPVGAVDGIDDYSQFTGNLSAQTYYELTIKVQSGYTLSLENISFGMRRSGTGVRNYSVRSSRDNFSFDLAAGTGTNTKISVIPTNVLFWNYDSVSTSSDQKGSLIDLSHVSFKSIEDSVTFRFYAWNAETGGGTFSIDNVVIKGVLFDSISIHAGIRELRNECPVYMDQDKISARCLSEAQTISVYDCKGQLMQKKYLPGETIDVSFLPQGLYIIVMRLENGTDRRIKFIRG